MEREQIASISKAEERKWQLIFPFAKWFFIEIGKERSLWQGYHQPNWAEMAVFRSLFCSHAEFSSLVFMVYWTHFAKKKLFFALFENLPEKVFLFLPQGLYFCYVCDIMFALIILYQHLLKIILEWFACLLYFDMSTWFMSALQSNFLSSNISTQPVHFALV